MGSMKRKELRKLLAHFLKLNQNFLPGQKSLTSFQAKLHYLNIVSELPSYGAKCFSTNLRDATMETVLLVSPKFGISQILGIRNSVVSQCCFPLLVLLLRYLLWWSSPLLSWRNIRKRFVISLGTLYHVRVVPLLT